MAEPDVPVVASETVAAENGAAGETVDTGSIADVKNGKGELKTLDKKIIKQIEYYFGDVNLPKDKFLQEQIKLDDGWIPLDIMLKFKRLSELSTDTEVILDALAKSDSKLMEISEDRKKIRRSSEKPLPILNEERRKELVTRTIYAKGFPAKGMTLDDFLAIFAKYGPLENLHMRTLKDKATGEVIFKGSVYVMFKALEDAKAFMELESVKHEETELVRMWQAAHLDLKRQERDSKKEKVKLEAKEGKVKQEGSAKTEPSTPNFSKGCVLHLQGFTGEITREDIKSELVALGAEIAFVTYNKGDSEAWVRLEKENTAKDILEKMDEGKLEVCGCELQVRVLEGEEEDTFLTKSMADLKSRRSKPNHRSGGRGGRGNFRGGRGRGGFRGRGGNKRRGDRDGHGDGPPAKQQKT